MLSLDLQAGIRVKLLQIITNTLEDNQEAASYLENHIYIILKSSELDMQNLMCREWVVLIIRILTQLKPGIEEKIQEIRHRIK